MRRIPLLFPLLLAMILLAAPAQAAPQPERRVALVIGNGAYPTAPLKNPVNDAADMDAALKRLGFETILLKNASMQQMETAVREFGLKLRSGGLGLFYYAGHGVQVGGENYLVPVNAAIQSEGDVKYGCLPAGLVLAKMEDARNGVNVVILDACRNNPFRQFFRSSEAGLARMDAPTGSLIAYATGPGKVAADGNGRNGLYTQHLLRNIATPGLSVTDMFMNVREAVVRDSGRKQVPWENTSLIGRFSFAGGTQTASLGPSSSPYTPAPPPKISAPPKPGSGTVDLSDIDADAAARAKAEAAAKAEQARLDAAARKEWAARLKAMQADFAKVQTVEKSGKYSADMKAKAWERFAGAYTGENPYTDQDQTLRSKAQAQQAHWEAEARRLADAQAASLAAAQAKKQQMLAMAATPSQPPNAGAPLKAPVGSPGKTWTDPTTGMEFVWVPQGCFQMGSPSSEAGRDSDEGPVHQVCVSGLWVGKYEVTNAQYRRFKSGHYSGDYNGQSANGERQPAVIVSWDDAKAYAQWLSGQGNGKFWLLTEAEWEYAARAGTTTSRYWGDNPDDTCKYANVHDQTSKRTNGFSWVAHNCDDGYAVAAPVGSFRPNAFGLYDMLGNVDEWVEDVKASYTSASQNDPVVTGGESRRVYRGGTWLKPPGGVRAAVRFNGRSVARRVSLGFRLARTN